MAGGRRRPDGVRRRWRYSIKATSDYDGHVNFSNYGTFFMLTRPLILRDETGIYYLKILDGWMEAYDLTSWWSVAGVPPHGVDVALEQPVATKNVDLLDGGGASGWKGEKPSLADARAPAVYISTTPAALIVTDGPPRFAPVEGTSLAYLENTTAKVFREPTDQELYVLIAERWFRSWTTAGRWEFVPNDRLPADVAKIPASQLKSNSGGFE